MRRAWIAPEAVAAHRSSSTGSKLNEVTGPAVRHMPDMDDMDECAKSHSDRDDTCTREAMAG